METNKTIQMNLGTFNIPTLVAIAGLGVMVFNAGWKQSDLDSRLTNIEKDRAVRSAQTMADIADLRSKTADIENIKYRVSLGESNISNANTRIDRVVDNFGNGIKQLSDSVGALTAKIEVLSTKLETMQASERGTVPK